MDGRLPGFGGVARLDGWMDMICLSVHGFSYCGCFPFRRKELLFFRVVHTGGIEE